MILHQCLSFENIASIASRHDEAVTRARSTGTTPPRPPVIVGVGMDATLWSAVLYRAEGVEEPVITPGYPARLMRTVSDGEVHIVGVERSRLLHIVSVAAAKQRVAPEFRFVWRIAPKDSPEIKLTDAATRRRPRLIMPPDDMVHIPIEPASVAMSYSQSTTGEISVGIGSISTMLSYDVVSQTLSTPWFTPPVTWTWSLETPIRMIEGVARSVLPSSWARSLLASDEPTTMPVLETAPREHVD